MLKTEIIECLKDTLPVEVNQEVLGHAADAVIGIVIKVIGGAIGCAIAAYIEKATQDD